MLPPTSSAGPISTLPYGRAPHRAPDLSRDRIKVKRAVDVNLGWTGRWLDEAIAGKSIGITHKGTHRQAPTSTGDRGWGRGGMTGEELDQAASRMLEQGEKVLSAGKAISWKDFKQRRNR